MHHKYINACHQQANFCLFIPEIRPHSPSLSWVCVLSRYITIIYSHASASQPAIGRILDRWSECCGWASLGEITINIIIVDCPTTLLYVTTINVPQTLWRNFIMKSLMKNWMSIVMVNWLTLFIDIIIMSESDQSGCRINAWSCPGTPFELII